MSEPPVTSSSLAGELCDAEQTQCRRKDAWPWSWRARRERGTVAGSACTAARHVPTGDARDDDALASPFARLVLAHEARAVDGEEDEACAVAEALGGVQVTQQDDAAAALDTHTISARFEAFLSTITMMIIHFMRSIFSIFIVSLPLVAAQIASPTCNVSAGAVAVWDRI